MSRPIYGDTVGGGGGNLKKIPQSDWEQTNDTQLDFIKNKPTLGELAAKDEITKNDLDEELQKKLGNIIACTEKDNGKFLRVVDGVPAWSIVSNAEDNTF